MHARLEFSGTKNAAAAEATAIPAQNTGAKPRSKFSKRFNMTGSGMSDASGLAERSQLGTPSTSAASTQATSPPDNRGSAIQEVKGDQNQWIKRPKGLGILGQQIIDSGERVEDPVDVHSKLGEREFNILQDYMNMWTRSIGELLQKLRETVPKEGMIGEVHYWRDLARVLEAISQELKQSFVETVLQILVLQESNEAIQNDVKRFYTEKERVSKGNKEAQWNHKYMKIIEQPVQTIERAEDLK